MVPYHAHNNEGITHKGSGKESSQLGFSLMKKKFLISYSNHSNLFFHNDNSGKYFRRRDTHGTQSKLPEVVQLRGELPRTSWVPLELGRYYSTTSHHTSQIHNNATSTQQQIILSRSRHCQSMPSTPKRPQLFVFHLSIQHQTIVVIQNTGHNP